MDRSAWEAERRHGTSTHAKTENTGQPPTNVRGRRFEQHLDARSCTRARMHSPAQTRSGIQRRTERSHACRSKFGDARSGVSLHECRLDVGRLACRPVLLSLNQRFTVVALTGVA
jgi:hypothetical protein